MADIQIRDLLAQVDAERLRRDLHYLCVDPLPVRRANYALPGHARSTLDETDDFLTARLESLGYAVRRDPRRAQAFRCRQHAPKSTWYAAPHHDDPWYEVANIIAETPGGSHPGEVIIACAHKDSQSWVASPGAYDNAVGTVGLLEIARLLARQATHRTVRLIWCCEEHHPWTSHAAAAQVKEAGEDLVGVLNLDGLAGRGPVDEAAGKRSLVCGWTIPPGDQLAALAAEVNASYGLGLECSAVQREFANDDDGSFVKAGFGAAILCIGSFPYRHEFYHDERDTADRVDVDLLASSVQCVLGTILRLDRQGPGW